MQAGEVGCMSFDYVLGGCGESTKIFNILI